MNPIAHRFVWFGSFVLVILAVVFGAQHELSKREKKIRDLQNRIASEEQTVQVREGVFTKQAHDEAAALREMLDGQEAELVSLRRELQKRREDVFSLTTINAKLKEQLSQGRGTQTEVEEGGKVRKRVDFEAPLGPMVAKGHTLTDPPEYQLELRQVRPLRLSVAFSIDEHGGWHSYVTSSEKDLQVDIGSGAVDSSLLSRRWYERIGLAAAAGVGPQSGAGRLGLLFDLGRFELGPSAWFLVGNSGIDRLYGVDFVWRPFFRSR